MNDFVGLSKAIVVVVWFLLLGVLLLALGGVVILNAYVWGRVF